VVVTPCGDVDFAVSTEQQNHDPETWVSYHITTWRHNAEELDLNLHRREHFKSR